LQLEITESAVLSEEPVVMENLNRLADAGLSIAVDDYGTGYSSLSYLHKLPVNTIKIDQSFVMGMQDDANLRAIVASTISLSHALGLSVVAEGVETEELHEQLKILGCDELQGYYFSKPIPTAEFELLHRNYMQAPRAMNFTAVDVQGRSA